MPSPPYRKTPLKGQQHVQNVLDDAVKNGLTVVRRQQLLIYIGIV